MNKIVVTSSDLISHARGHFFTSIFLMFMSFYVDWHWAFSLITLISSVYFMLHAIDYFGLAHKARENTK